jgi:hypothetical protein
MWTDLSKRIFAPQKLALLFKTSSSKGKRKAERRIRALKSEEIKVKTQVLAAANLHCDKLQLDLFRVLCLKTKHQ